MHSPCVQLSLLRAATRAACACASGWPSGLSEQQPAPLGLVHLAGPQVQPPTRRSGCPQRPPASKAHVTHVHVTAAGVLEKMMALRASPLLAAWNVLCFHLPARHTWLMCMSQQLVFC
eukprot:1160090-Pelagomonas_calceolata.AAC.10